MRRSERNLPRVLIFGRPNVGKSTLFNLLVGKRHSITAHEAGITRDYLEEECDLGGRRVLLVDSGGVGDPVDDIAVLAEARTQTLLAEADIVLFLVDTNGLTIADYDVANSLRRYADRVILVINKSDRLKGPADNYLQMGYEPYVLVSAAHNRGMDELGELVAQRVASKPSASDSGDDEQGQGLPSLAIAGRPNVGKSTLLNCLLGFERSLVADLPGVTRDSVHAKVSGDHPFILIDTAGTRRGRIRKDEITFFADLRAQESTKHADVALVLIDAVEGMTEQDARIATSVMKQGTPVLFVVNKWDLVHADEEEFRERMLAFFPRLRILPVVFCSALTGSEVPRILPAAQRIVRRASKRIATPQLNKRIPVWTERFPVPMRSGKRARILYATQVATRPPCFVFFVNRMSGIDGRYTQYLENRIREDFFFEAVPLRIEFQQKNAS